MKDVFPSPLDCFSPPPSNRMLARTGGSSRTDRLFVKKRQSKKKNPEKNYFFTGWAPSGAQARVAWVVVFLAKQNGEVRLLISKEVFLLTGGCDVSR